MGVNGLAQAMMQDNNLLLRRLYELGALSKDTALPLGALGIDYTRHPYALNNIDFERLYGNVGKVGNRYYLKRTKYVERNCLGSIYRIFDPKKIREWQYAHDRLPPPPEGEAEFLSLEQVSISRPGMESKK